MKTIFDIAMHAMCFIGVGIIAAAVIAYVAIGNVNDNRKSEDEDDL
ncbi:MAG TPA: hypothetical protein PL045_07070 [Chitinophagaceae bacterium]|nr:hypothetical protein [Chitinophagaceae bacterium]